MADNATLYGNCINIIIGIIMDIKDKTRKSISTALGNFSYYSLEEFSNDRLEVRELPFSIRILLENIVRNFNNVSFNKTHLDNILNWKSKQENKEIPYLPSRVLMQDFTGVPSIVDIASIRSEVARKNTDPGLNQSTGSGRPDNRPFCSGGLFRD